MGIFNKSNINALKIENEKMSKQLIELKLQIDTLKQENDTLKNIQLSVDQLQYIDLKKEIPILEKKRDNINSEINQANDLYTKRLAEIKEKENQIIQLDDEILYQSFGFYNPRYNFEHSFEYKNRLDELRTQQKQVVINHSATYYNENWLVNGSARAGKKLANENVKMIVRAFNHECDAAIYKVKFNNIEAIEKRIRISYNILNKMHETLEISITEQYLNLKIQELYLVYEYECKREEEREIIRCHREEERENKAFLKEVAEKQKKLNKEELHYIKMINELKNKFESAHESQKDNYEKRIKDLEEQLARIADERADIDYRLKYTGAGYVYIISNVGSFGENIYKIGVTRRLDPMERIRELGRASVPFGFDVHALIFSKNAYQLESSIHKTFDNNKVNQINLRKEFFQVSLNEIESAIRKNHDSTVEFIKVPEAEEYRKSLAMKKNNLKINF